MTVKQTLNPQSDLLGNEIVLYLCATTTIDYSFIYIKATVQVSIPTSDLLEHLSRIEFQALSRISIGLLDA